MKVLFDLDGFKNTYGGVARCTVELIAHLPSDIQYELAISVSKNAYLKDYRGVITDISESFLDKRNFLPGLNFKGKGRLFDFLEKKFSFFPTYNNINKPISIRALKSQDFDLFHCPSTDCDTYFLQYLENKPFILTVHDMISEIYGSNNNHQNQVKNLLIPKASHIVTVSQKTKEDLLSFYNLPEDKISVIYHGAPEPERYKRYNVFKFPYFLFVGNRHSYKNFAQTITDFSLFHVKHPEVVLVVVGPRLTVSEKKLINGCNLEKSVINFAASEEQLCNLYRNAIGFIFPSLYEGFGIPILEAFSYGCPALLNDTSCFPEIAGDAALFFHSRPQEHKSNLSEAMEVLYNMSSDDRTKVINKGYKRASYFSWKESSNMLAEIYRNVGAM